MWFQVLKKLENKCTAQWVIRRPNLKHFAQKVRRPKVIKPNFPQKITRPSAKKLEDLLKITSKITRPNLFSGY